MPRKSAASADFPTATGNRLKPPADLTGPERAQFLDLVVSCEPDHFRQSDLPVLSAFCRASVMEKVAAGELAAAGYVGEDGKLSPWASLLKDAQRAVANYSRLLKLNPIARQPLPVKMEPQSMSYYDRMALMEEAKRDDAN
jgi:phage terminase small subunit